MKTLPFAASSLSFALLVTACTEADRTTVTRKRYPNSEVVKIPDSASKYARRDSDGSVWIFETTLKGGDADPFVSEEYLLFPPTNPAPER